MAPRPGWRGLEMVEDGMEVHFGEAATHIGATDRIRRQTDPSVLRRIDRDTDLRIMWYTKRSVGELRERLVELDNEPDVEGSIAARGALLVLANAVMGGSTTKDLIPLLRRLGVRTRSEIDRERQALRSLVRSIEGVPAAAASPTSAGQPAPVGV
jgi:hypothetical protein